MGLGPLMFVGEECADWEDDRPISAIGSITQLSADEMDDIEESVVGFELPEE